MTFTIRSFCDADYAPLADLCTVIYEHRISPESIRRDDETRDPRCLHRCWVAEADGQLVGYGEYVQYPGVYHPRKFDVSLGVLPTFRRRGIGGALHNTVLEALRPFDPISLTAGVREDHPHAIAFAEHRGFAEAMRNWESVLDLTVFDPEAFKASVEAAKARGYEFRSYADLADLPDRDRRIHALAQETRRDVPSPEPLTDVPFEQWAKGFQSPGFLPGAYWLAMKEGELVGLTNIWKSDEAEALKTGLTAVSREHRGNGVAMALKVCALAAAKAGGFRSVKTWNETHNHGMLAINARLGFERKPAWITVLQRFHPETE